MCPVLSTYQDDQQRVVLTILDQRTSNAHKKVPVHPLDYSLRGATHWTCLQGLPRNPSGTCPPT